MFNFLRPSPPAPQMPVAELIAKAKKGELLLIDVRERSELQTTGTAQHAQHIPVGLIAMKADPKSPDYDKRFRADTPIAVFCASGGRSGMAAQTLGRLGYQATNLGGFAGLAQAGVPVIRV